MEYVRLGSTGLKVSRICMGCMEVNGSNPVHMVKEDANCWFPHVSPDGEWVVYIAYSKIEEIGIAL